MHEPSCYNTCLQARVCKHTTACQSAICVNMGLLSSRVLSAGTLLCRLAARRHTSLCQPCNLCSSLRSCGSCCSICLWNHITRFDTSMTTDQQLPTFPTPATSHNQPNTSALSCYGARTSAVIPEMWLLLSHCHTKPPSLHLLCTSWSWRKEPS